MPRKTNKKRRRRKNQRKNLTMIWALVSNKLSLYMDGFGFDVNGKQLGMLWSKLICSLKDKGMEQMLELYINLPKFLM